MSEEQDQTAQELLSVQIDASADWFLQLLVKIVNGKDDMAFPITLNVSGIIISGELVSGHRYFEGFAKDFKEGFLAVAQKMEMIWKAVLNNWVTFIHTVGART
jgi:hypothetical protein